MSKEERKELVRSAAEAHAELSGIASRLHRRLAIDDAGHSRRREALAKLRRRRQVIDPDRLRS